LWRAIKGYKFSPIPEFDNIEIPYPVRINPQIKVEAYYEQLRRLNEITAYREELNAQANLVMNIMMNIRPGEPGYDAKVQNGIGQITALRWCANELPKLQPRIRKKHQTEG